MLKLLKDWKGDIEINDKRYTSEEFARNIFKNDSDSIHIVLHSVKQKVVSSVPDASKSVSSAVEQVITVKKYMTQKASPGFDFMAKFNNDVPMPMRVMQGTVEKETRGMVYMNLHGFAKPTVTCFCCGKELTNPVSRQYGIGPICLGKMGIVRDIADVKHIKEDIVKITWSGWIIKSAITNTEEV